MFTLEQMSSSIPDTHSEYRRTGHNKGVEGGIVLNKNVPVPKPGRGYAFMPSASTIVT